MSDLISFANKPIAMSSLEIAELTGKDHFNVLRDIKCILKEAEIDQLKFEGVYLGGNGQERRCYNLPRLECDLVVSGYSTKYRLAIIKRWHELEKQVPTLPTTYREALVALVEQVEINETLLPKANALDRISAGEGSQCLTDAAKALKVKPKELRLRLQSMRWIYRRAGGKNWVGYQNKIDQNLVEHRIVSYKSSDIESNDHVTEQVLLTPKGIAKLASMDEFK
jgi:Rha family phage regulatory protein